MNKMQPTNSSSSATKWVVFVIGSLCIVSLLLVAVLVAIALPMIQQIREANRRQAVAQNVKNIGLALQNYETSMAAQSGQASKPTAGVRTVDAVRQIVATQLGVDMKEVTESTSLADLQADDLDFVDLVMELEEHFAITIPDKTITVQSGQVLPTSQFNELTMLKLAEIVDQCR